MQFSEDQILQLAPDAASAKAGQQLSITAKWVARFAHGKALWAIARVVAKFLSHPHRPYHYCL